MAPILESPTRGIALAEHLRPLRKLKSDLLGIH
jgi:hypothetical protein